MIRLSQRPSDPVTQCIILTIVRFQNGFGPIVKAKKPRLPQLQYQNHQIVHCTYLLQVSTWALKHYTNDSRLQRKLLVLQKFQQLLIFRPAAKKCCVFKSLTFKMSPISQTGCRYSFVGVEIKGFMEFPDHWFAHQMFLKKMNPNFSQFDCRTTYLPIVLGL